MDPLAAFDPLEVCDERRDRDFDSFDSFDCFDCFESFVDFDAFDPFDSLAVLTEASAVTPVLTETSAVTPESSDSRDKRLDGFDSFVVLDS